ncbi:MAG: lipid export permease/ATP-binding protein MsbA, partial [Pseudomonadota bacterium]
MKSLLQRLRRIWPYFSPSRAGFIVSAICTVIVAATEPMVPSLMQRLLDSGFKQGAAGIPLWQVPVAIIGLFAVRGAAGYVGQYMLAWVAYRGTQGMREALFRRLMDAHPQLYATHSASTLTNMVAHEVQAGALQLSTSGLTLLRDLLTLVALLGYLLWINWQLTLFVSVLFP